MKRHSLRCHCNDPAQMFRSTGLAIMHSPLVGDALQNRLKACLCHCNYSYGYFLLQRCAVGQLKCTVTLVCAECMPHCSVVFCPQQACVTAITPMGTCSSYRSALSQLKGTPARVWASCISQCSVMLCKTGLQQAYVIAITSIYYILICRIPQVFEDEAGTLPEQIENAYIVVGSCCR